MRKTHFHISEMDCPSEENLIRMKLAELSDVRGLEFDLQARTLWVWHEGQTEPILASLEGLKLGTRLVDSEAADSAPSSDEHQQQRRALWAVLAINLSFFFIEATTGLLSRSMGLVADSLDMLADAVVYGLSLLAVGAAVARKKGIAKAAGYFQILLAILGFSEVLRRFFGAEQMPDFTTMIVVSALALLANSACLYLLQRTRGKEEAHMQASLIFTSNDVLINLGVILAGVLVRALDSNKPDLIIGTLVFVFVLRGARRILKLAQ